MINPASEYIVVQPDEHITKMTAGGLYIPDNAKVHKQGLTRTGTVIAVGPGRRGSNGERIPLDCKVGDRVVYEQYSGFEHQFDFEDGARKLRMIRDSDILGVIDAPTWQESRDEMRKEGWQQ